jgi:NitT/TauT family transport system substrate-binding protein
MRAVSATLRGAHIISRRELLRGAAVGAAGLSASVLFGCGGGDAGEETDDRLPEVTTIRLPKVNATCVGPMLMAREHLVAEGFSDIHYVPMDRQYSLINAHLRDRRVDFAMQFTPVVAAAVNDGDPFVALAASHVACFQFFAGPGIASIGDLRGKSMAIDVPDPKPIDYAFVTSILQWAGLSPGRDVELLEWPRARLAGPWLADGRVGAFMAIPPLSQTMRDSNQGHVVLDSMRDRPWSQYVCCLVVTHREFMERYPVATRRALRAILKGVDACTAEPERSAKALWENGWIGTEHYAAEVFRMLPYGAWRTYSPEDALRFYSLRLAEAGTVTATPEEIITRGSDWTMLDSLRQELEFAPTPVAGRGLFGCDIPVTVARANAEEEARS